MPVGLYLDHNVRRAIADGLRARGISILTALEDKAHELPDPDLLDRATHLGRPIFTCDDDLLAEAHRRQQLGINFAGVIFAHQLEVPVGRCIADLELIAQLLETSELQCQVVFLPLR